MGLSRRSFLSFALASTGVALGEHRCSAASPDSSPAPAGDPDEPAATQVGVLVDTTLCIGCRKCEEACYRRNDLPRPAEGFDDPSVLRRPRRPDARRFTVVNSYPGAPSRADPDQSDTFVKLQCMHCLEPACVSACIVGALARSDEGVVVYDPSICIGCRYCLLACPFEVLAYEFAAVVAPRVRKCELCTDRAAGTGANPACAAACPVEALVFAPRPTLLELAHQRIAARPDVYVDHVYGEREAGGTSWLYLLGRPAAEVGLPSLPPWGPSHRTESIQHSLYRYGAIPLAVYGSLAAVMWLCNRSGHPRSGSPRDPEGPKTGAPEVEP
jgi:formate dehydrogenase iron-sulfur subunit